jgi:hypothetical protein
MEGPELYRDVRRPLWAMVTLTALPQGYAKLSGTSGRGICTVVALPTAISCLGAFTASPRY